MKQIALRPHDVAVALQLAISRQETYAALSHSLCLSASEVHQSVTRLRAAKLLGVSAMRQIRKRSLEEFLEHGVKFAFPAALGPVVRGIPTAHSGPALSAHFGGPSTAKSAEDVFVWPHADGEVRGTSLTPLYPGAPKLAKRNQQLYALLTLVDAMRIGKARERNLAKSMLSRAINADLA